MIVKEFLPHCLRVKREIWVFLVNQEPRALQVLLVPMVFQGVKDKQAPLELMDVTAILANLVSREQQ